MNTGALSPWLKWPLNDANRSLPSSAEVQNFWGYISAFPRTLTSVHKDSFTLCGSSTSYYLFKAQWLLYVPPALTFTNSTFCPHDVIMCFVRISEQRAIISLYSIKWLASITEQKSVYSAVWTGSLNTVPLKSRIEVLSSSRLNSIIYRVVTWGGVWRRGAATVGTTMNKCKQTQRVSRWGCPLPTVTRTYDKKYNHTARLRKSLAILAFLW